MYNPGGGGGLSPPLGRSAAGRRLPRRSDVHRSELWRPAARAKFTGRVVSTNAPMFSSRTATFVPHKQLASSHSEGEASWKSLAMHSVASLGAGDMRLEVTQPPQVSLNEWLAVQTVGLHHSTGLCFSLIAPSMDPCAKMSAGPTAEYLWKDPTRPDTRPRRLPAKEYCTLLLDWVQQQIDDPTLFPMHGDQPFPSNFPKVIAAITRRLFRIFAHIYHHCLAIVIDLGAEPHLNTSFKHLLFFAREFQLIKKRELAPLANIIQAIDARQRQVPAHVSGVR
jgi:MOB kinase activator 1